MRFCVQAVNRSGGRAPPGGYHRLVPRKNGRTGDASSQYVPAGLGTTRTDRGADAERATGAA